MSNKRISINDTILSNAKSSSNDNTIEARIKDNRALVDDIVKKYVNTPLEREDLVQEGMIGLLAAIKTYKSEKGASFKTYASTCIDNSIQSALRKFNRKKDIPAKEMVEYQEELIPENNGHISAEDSFIAQENIALLNRALSENLSDFENEVLRLHIVGLSYSEIAARLCKSPKAVDNALQRIRKKLAGIVC